MNIYIDESGSFVSATSYDKWNFVVGICAAETARRSIARALADIKRWVSVPLAQEVKLAAIPEEHYFRFLEQLDLPYVVAFAVGTDAGTNDDASVMAHQRLQVEKIRVHVPRMRYPGGRAAVATLADGVERLSPQLYVQLWCQVSLMEDILVRAPLYFVQRVPATLGAFRWRIDQKNAAKPEFEETFKRITPPLLQTRSLENPAVSLIGADYRHFAKFRYEPGQVPDYLKEEYGIEIGGGVNVGKVIRDDMRFEDSRNCEGVQIADLVAAGFRRCFRGEFSNNDEAAKLLGRLMLRDKGGAFSVNMLTFADRAIAGDRVSRTIRRVDQFAKNMLLRV